MATVAPRAGTQEPLLPDGQRSGGQSSGDASCLAIPLVVVLLFIVARRSETACNPEDLQHVKPPYDGNLLPSYFILSEHLNLSRADTIVNVYDKHWVSLGHFYQNTYGHFGYSDPSNRIWFDAGRPMLTKMFSSLPKQYNLQQCNVDFGGQRGGIFDVSEDKVHEGWFCEFKKGCLANIYNITASNVQGDVHHVANAIFGFDYLKNATLGSSQFYKWRTQWYLNIVDPTDGSIIAHAKQHVFSNDGFVTLTFSNWTVDISESSQLPNWVVGFLTAFNDVHPQDRFGMPGANGRRRRMAVY